MTKQEVIKNAYGEHWETVKDYVDGNGWCNWDYKNNCSPSRFEISEFDTLDFKLGKYLIWRPKSLQGIENNNGWIKIESESDLPKESEQYWCVLYDEVGILQYYSEAKIWEDIETENRSFPSHYQQINKPLKPLY